MEGMLDAQSDIRGQVATLVRRESPVGALRAAASSAAGFDFALWAKARESGWFEMLLPEEAGGLGLPLSEVALLFYEVGRNPVAGPLVDNVVAAAVVAGRSRDGGSLAWSEGVVSLADPAAVPTAGQGVHLDESGRLTGKISLVRFAGACDTLLVMLGDGSEGIVRLPMPCQGVDVRAPVTLDATTRVAEIVLTAVPLDVGELLIGPEAGAAVARELRAAIRLAMAAETAGLCHSMVEMASAYVALRTQFGRPVGCFQGVQQIAAEMYETASRLCSLLDAAVEDLDVGAGPAVAEQKAASLSAAAASAGRDVAEMGLQLHGGIGYTSEHDLSLFYQRVLALESQYGGRRERNSALGRALLAAGTAA
jgi:alkylation response protein AidB-like acyl-CoA dehydrogenase